MANFIHMNGAMHLFYVNLGIVNKQECMLVPVCTSVKINDFARCKMIAYLFYNPID